MCRISSRGTGGRTSLWITCFMLLLLSCIFVNCSGPSDGNGPRGNSEPRAITAVLFLLFDPTILKPEETTEIEVIADSMETFFMDIPERTAVVLFLIQRGAVHERPTYEKDFFFDSGHGGEKRHEASLRGEFNRIVRPRLIHEWGVAHRPENVRQLTSCLLSTLFVVGKEAEAFRCGDPGVSCHVVLVSDMLEACDEWDGGINLERGVAVLAEIDALGVEIDLSAIDSAVLVQAPNGHIVKPREVLALERFWSDLFVSSGVCDGRVFYGRRFPVEMDLSACEQMPPGAIVGEKRVVPPRVGGEK